MAKVIDGETGEIISRSLYAAEGLVVRHRMDLPPPPRFAEPKDEPTWLKKSKIAQMIKPFPQADKTALSYLDALIDPRSPARKPAARSVFSEDGGPSAREARGLVNCAISGRRPNRKSVEIPCVHVDVYADMVRVRVAYTKNRERSRDPKLTDAETLYLRAERDGIKAEAPDSEDKPARRGAITGYSRRARNRFLQSMSMCRNLDGRSYFLTLTVPDAFAIAHGLEAARMAKELKRCWRALLKRLRRRWPECYGWWRVEFQDRKSGELLGQVVPHVHLLFWPNVKAIRDFPLHRFRQWLALAWYMVVGAADPKHLLAGTQLDVINDRRHAMAYAAKYAAKESDDDLLGGRRWGMFGPVDLEPTNSVDLYVYEWIQLKRMIASWMVGQARRSKRDKFGMFYPPAPEIVAKRKRFAGRFRGRLPTLGGFFLGLGDKSPVAKPNQGRSIQRMIGAALRDAPLAFEGSFIDF